MAEKPETPKILEEISKGTNPKSGAASSRSQKNARRRFLIILLMFLPLFGGLAYLGYFQMSVQSELVSLQQQNATLEAAIAQYQSQLNTLNSELANIPQQVEIDDSATRELSSRVDSELAGLEAQLNALAAEQASNVAPQNFEWKILEANYLVQLANRKLQLEADRQSALVLLEQADAALLESGSNNVLRARQAIADDLVLLRELQTFDREGLYIRIGNLRNEVSTIDLLSSMREGFQSQRNESSTAVIMDTEQQGFIDSSLEFLSSVFVWRRWEDSPQAILVPGQETLILQRMYLILERAQLALMSSDTALYQRSLAEGLEWLRQFAVVESSAGQAVAAELSALQQIDIAPQLPALSQSTTAVQQLAANLR
ncbi:MAG: uroporphyrinogen-III C-methyltransferase [Pseudomonadales bacterium]|nr:uroporphyrinogen-III C-methyltransferase [Pseudomonadales bacterium]